MKKAVRKGRHVSAAVVQATTASHGPALKAKKITVDIPQSLLDAAAEMVCGRQLTTSALVREAMEYYVEQKRERRLEQELEQGYLATADLGERVHRGFEYVDAEN